MANWYLIKHKTTGAFYHCRKWTDELVRVRSVRANSYQVGETLTPEAARKHYKIERRLTDDESNKVESEVQWAIHR